MQLHAQVLGSGCQAGPSAGLHQPLASTPAVRPPVFVFGLVPLGTIFFSFAAGCGIKGVFSLLLGE